MITILLPNVTMIQAGRRRAGERSSVELTVVTELSRRVAGVGSPSVHLQNKNCLPGILIRAGVRLIAS